MECTKDKMYFLIETLRRCQMNATQINDIISTAWPDEALNFVRIRSICLEFTEETRSQVEVEHLQVTEGVRILKTLML